MRKFHREILKKLPRGWTIEHRSGKHPKIIGPDGQRCIIGSTPKNTHHAIVNALTALRKAGVKVGRGVQT